MKAALATAAKAAWRWLAHIGSWEITPRFGQFGVWDCKCKVCAREWEDFDP